MEAEVFWAAFGGGAAAGVVGLAAVLVVEYIRSRREAPHLNVSVTLGYEIGGVPDRSNVRLAFIQASNPRSIPITINSFGWDYGKGRMLLWGFNTSYATLPYSLQPGASTDARIEVDLVIDGLRKNGLLPSDLKGAVVRTAIGRDFKGRIHKKTIKTLKEAYEGGQT